MNKKELIAALANKTGSTKAGANLNVLGLTEIISATLRKGGKITLSGFGIFEVRERAARIGRNPRTGETMKIKATKVPAFKAGNTLKAALNGVGE
jgi:DNA-binding protein HU-beta